MRLIQVIIVVFSGTSFSQSTLLSPVQPDGTIRFPGFPNMCVYKRWNDYTQMLIRTVEPEVQGYRKLKNSPKPPECELFRRGISLVGSRGRISRKKRIFEIRGSKNVFFGQKSIFSKIFRNWDQKTAFWLARVLKIQKFHFFLFYRPKNTLNNDFLTSWGRYRIFLTL